jgi:hypothetical protein
MRGRVRGRKALSEDAVRGFKANVTERLNKAMKTYRDANQMPGAVRSESTGCDFETAELTVWLSGLGMCEDYANLCLLISSTLPDCETKVTEGLCDNDRTSSRCVRVKPNQQLLADMEVRPPPPRLDQSSNQSLLSAGDGQSARSCGVIWTLLAILFVALLAVAIYVFTDFLTFTTLESSPPK